MTKSRLLGPAVRRTLFASATLAVLLCGCEWMASLGVPKEIREKGLLSALEEPMPLDQPFDDGFSQFQVEHESEMRALLARMAEFAEGLQNPMLREAYVESLKKGEPSRARAFYDLYVNQSGGIPSSDKQFALWERIDKALAEGDEPELLEDRIVALAAFVAHAEPVNAARLTAAIRDEWNPESENWHLVFSAIYQPFDVAWTEAWRTASQKNLDNEMGEAILERLSWSETELVAHPFESPQNFALLTERMRKSQDPDELNRLVGLLTTLHFDQSRELWLAATERSAGHARLNASLEMWRKGLWPKAADYLKKVAAEEEGYAVLALDLLSRMGQLEGVARPTGERLARAKAYHAVATYVLPPDGAVEEIGLTPIASGKATLDGDELELTVFRYSVPPSLLQPWSAGANGIVIVDERLVLAPDESPAAADPTAASMLVESASETELASLDRALDEAALREQRKEGCATLLDVIALLDPAFGLGRPGDASADPYDWEGRKARLVSEDERWKAFDLPLDGLGLDLTARDETEPVEPGTDAAPEDETTP